MPFCDDGRHPKLDVNVNAFIDVGFVEFEDVFESIVNGRSLCLWFKTTKNRCVNIEPFLYQENIPLFVCALALLNYLSVLYYLLRFMGVWMIKCLSIRLF